MLILEASPMGTRSRKIIDPEDADAALPFSEDDKRLMKSFKIRMD